jgi:histidine triad (HIT) family protein
VPADCIFCQIVAGQLPATMLYQDDEITAFRDIQAQATSHVLVIPNRHIASLGDTSDADIELLGRILRVAVSLAKEEGIAESGYRVVTNTGHDAQQSVDHLHFHLLGGNTLVPRLG